VCAALGRVLYAILGVSLCLRASAILGDVRLMAGSLQVCVLPWGEYSMLIFGGVRTMAGSLQVSP
jgi:hypothetical protein